MGNKIESLEEYKEELILTFEDREQSNIDTYALDYMDQWDYDRAERIIEEKLKDLPKELTENDDFKWAYNVILTTALTVGFTAGYHYLADDIKNLVECDGIG